MNSHLQATPARRAAQIIIGLCMILLLGCWRLPAQNPPITSASIVSIRNELAVGGTVLLQFNGSVTASTPLVISQDTVLDATGFSVTISGGNTSQIFNVASNAHFTVINLTLIGGNSIGKAGTAGTTGSSGTTGNNGGNGNPGGNGLGGALFNAGFTTMEDCIVSNDIVTGGEGGPGGNGGNGSNGKGGNGGSGGSGGNAYGGAIYNTGGLTLTNCEIANNTATGGGGGNGGTNGSGTGTTSYPGSGGAGAMGAGAGLYNLGTATLVNCTFSQNNATSGSSVAAGGPPNNNGNGLSGANGPNSIGGGICNLGTATLVNCTLDQNSVTAGGGGDGGPGSGLGRGGAGGNGGNAFGGDLYNAGTTSVTNCTFADGSATGATGGAGGSGFDGGTSGSDGAGSGANIISGAGTFNLKNSILAYPANGFSAAGAITDLGNNISSDGTPGFTTTNSHDSLDPLLVPLDNNGGFALTMALLPGSPAIDAIFDSSAPSFDERDYPRPAGNRSDIGAYEYGSNPNLIVISGHVMLGAVPFPGVTVQAGSSLATTGSNGVYSFVLASNVNYTVFPKPLGFFNPQSANVTLIANISNLDFMATDAPTLFTNDITNRTLTLVFSAVPTFSYRIQAATNLNFTNPFATNWVDISTNTATSNTIFFITPTTNFTQRFFRTVTP
jgi:hypothetical protein